MWNVLLHPEGVSEVGVLTMGVATAGETRLAGVFPPEGTPTGKIAVFSSRFFFGFGSGAARTDVSWPHDQNNNHLSLTFVVLLHIETAQQHDGLLAEQASIDRERRIHAFIHVDCHDTAGAAEAIIEAAKVDAANAELAESRSAHDAGLDGYVEVGRVQDGRVVARHNLAESDELGVAGALFAVSLASK